MNQELCLPAEADLLGLADRVGEGRVYWGEETVQRYARDESTRLEALPTAVVLPRTAGEVCEVLRWAGNGRFPVIPRGAGTGVAGGAVAVGGGVVLSLERLDRILEVDEENLTVTCEPGVVTGRLQEAVEARGLFYPPDPASLESCSIGGNVAVGAGGARAVKYGTTRNYVLGLQAVTGEGRVLELGGKNVKDASGYHLLDLFVGSEGTLGVITRITLRLLPLPTRRVSLLLPFTSLDACARTVARTMRDRIVPAVAEFMDDVTIDAARKYLGRDLPGGERAGAYAILELDGDEPATLEAQMQRIGEIGQEEGSGDVFAAEDPGQQARLWESRRCVAEALRAVSPEIGKADVVVPRAAVPQLVMEVKAAGARHGLQAACFGHAGDGNVHVNLLRSSLDASNWARRLQAAMDDIMESTLGLGGLPSGEHGIGVLKKPHLGKFLSAESLELMRRIKHVFDPLGILNPGKVV